MTDAGAVLPAERIEEREAESSFFGLPKNTVLFGIVCDYDGNEEKNKTEAI